MIKISFFVVKDANNLLKNQCVLLNGSPDIVAEVKGRYNVFSFS